MGGDLLLVAAIRLRREARRLEGREGDVADKQQSSERGRDCYWRGVTGGIRVGRIYPIEVRLVARNKLQGAGAGAVAGEQRQPRWKWRGSAELGGLLSRVEQGNDQWWEAEEAGCFAEPVWCEW